MRRAWWAAMAMAWVGCADDGAPAPTPDVVHLVVSGVPPPAGFVVVASSATTTTTMVTTCPASGPAAGAASPLAVCEPGGVRVATASAVHLVVKALGFANAERDLDAHATAAVPLALTALPAPVQNDDYATAFGASDGARFEAMAIHVQTELGPTSAVKFFVTDLTGPAPTVYFQNTAAHPLHYTFARDVLGLPGTIADFERATYHGAARTQAAGTLVRYDTFSARAARYGADLAAPIALTFFPSDDLTPALALRLYHLIDTRLGFAPRSGGGARLVYLPAGDAQEAALAGAEDAFRQSDAAWVTRAELYGDLDQQLLNPGLAFGTLRRYSPEELATAVVSYHDILLLTRLPNELPIVGGTICEELQTPLAHVNVAAHARGTPNMSLLGASTRPELAPLIGQLVRFEIKDGAWSVRAATLAEAEPFWASRAPTPYTPTYDATTTGLLDFAAIGFADADKVGVKAANVAELSHLLGARAPSGFAVPFFYFQQYMTTNVVTAARCDGAHADCLEEARTPALCDAARALCSPSATAGDTFQGYVTRLLGEAPFEADTAVREAALDALRWLIRHGDVDPALASALDTEVAHRWGALTCRLRSSTNSEDLPNFSGAGLYESTAATATGAARASKEIRKIWAAVWSFRAFEERAFWSIDHLAVRMGIAVETAYPDEAANGVLITQNVVDPSTVGMYVNVQAGEVSVTNPTDGAVPEAFSMIEGPGRLIVARQRFSSLSPGTPILTDAEVTRLYLAAMQIQQHFAALYQQPESVLALDLEFKFHGSGRDLIVKQVRPYVTR